MILNYIKYFMNFLYWRKYNKRTNSSILNYNTPTSIVLGKSVMIRAKTEIGLDVRIGDFSYISGPVNYIEAAHIGRFCSIARQCVIGVGNHNYNWITTHPFLVNQEYDFIKENITEPQKPAPIIGNDVWIGINSIIQRGVKIGDGAVIASGSVVTKDVAPFSIVGGVPAKHLKFRFSEEQIQQLMKISWWDWDIKKIKAESHYMYNIDEFIKRNI